MKSWREYSVEFNEAIEKEWQNYMSEHYVELVERLNAVGIEKPEEIEKFFVKLKQDIQLDMIKTLKENLKSLSESGVDKPTSGPTFFGSS